MPPLPTTIDVLVLGAGPAGIEAALAARQAGYDVILLERGRVGDAIRRWGHVKLFSPWRLNTSERGRAVLEAESARLPDASQLPTGAGFVRDYLEPLARSQALAGVIRESVTAVAVTRDECLKGDLIGQPERREHRFRTLWRGADGEGVISSSIVIDATGVYRTPTATGNGGIPAPGESTITDRIDRHLPDALGEDRARYAGQHTLLVGGGYSAATAVRDLVRLAEEAEGTRITWVWRGEGPPLKAIEDDPLDEREGLTRDANGLAVSPPASLQLRPGEIVESFRPDGDRIAVELRRGDTTTSLTVDRVLSLVGYRPDPSLLRELQVHHCWATDGLMKLSASLLGSMGAGGDCLTLEAPGVETLLNPEPGLFVIGTKAYGRFSHYLMRNGIEQIDAIFAFLRDRTERAPE